MKKTAVGLLCGLFTGLWIGARVQSAILTGASPATDYHPDAVTYTNAQTVPIPESLETEDMLILKVFKEVFDAELNKSDERNNEENYWVHRTGILHIRKSSFIFQEAGEPAFYADAMNLQGEDSAKVFILRLSEIRKRMGEMPEGDFQDVKNKIIIPYAKKEARMFAEKNRK